MAAAHRALDKTWQCKGWEKRKGKLVWLDSPPRPYRIAWPRSGEPFVCALFVTDPEISQDERVTLSRELVEAGCRYAACAGIDCSKWDDAIDFAQLECDPNFDPPQETLVMTSWHENETPREVLEFALTWTDFADNTFKHLLVLILGDDSQLRSEIAMALRPLSIDP